MLEFLGNLLENIVNFFQTLWDFIINIFNEIVYIIQLLANVVTNIPNYFTWLPAPVLTLIILAISIVVIYKVMGREG